MSELKSHTQVAVIGGGVVGCSVLYHLTKIGWKDVVLLERDELTSGSTWHAAGGMHTHNSDPNVAKLQEYTINLYKEIEEISDQSCGLHITGGYTLASDDNWHDFLKMSSGRGRYLGLHSEFVSIKEAKEKFPFIEESCFTAALWDPLEGHVDPSGVTQAYAKSARIGGAEIYRHTKVEELKQRPDGTWDVVTDKGTIHAEHVVNAGGLWAREVGRMVGLELPVLAMEHQYLITEDIEEAAAIREAGDELPHILDLGGEIYMRQERNGVLIGTYEPKGDPWSPKVTPWEFGHELLEPNLDRIADNLVVGFEHYPKLGEAGIKQIINGPFTFAPDGNPLVGPVRGLKNFWCACGVMAGLSQGGGVGLALANWMADGDPGFDVWAMDVSRFGDYTTMAYTNAKVRENYGRRFKMTFPNEQLPAARPSRTTALYDRFVNRNAVMGAAYGLEGALWFAPEGEEAYENPTFRRSNAFPTVAEECKAVREACGIMEISSFAKYEVTGPDAEAWLNRMMPNRMPKVGRTVLTPMLNDAGKLIGDFTVSRADDERFYIFGSGIAENYHMRWFERHLPEGGVKLTSLANELHGLSVAGPNSREVLQRVVDEDLSTENFRFMSFKEMDVGIVPAKVGRITFTGDLGYEIWVRHDYLIALHNTLVEAGKDLGLRHFGSWALNSLRLEKSFGSWRTEFRPIYTPFEANLGRFVKLEKNDFIGRTAAQEAQAAGPKRQLVTFEVDVSDADVIANECVWHKGEVCGWITSGGYAHYTQKSLALGYVPAERAGEAEDWEIEIIGEKRPAKILSEPVFDPEALRMRT